MVSTSFSAVERRIRLAPAHRVAWWSVTLSASVVVTGLLASRLDYVPMWDGYEYASAINAAAAAPVRASSLRLGGHTSHAYAVLAITAQSLAPGRYWPVLLLNALLLLVSAIGFARLCKLCFPGRDSEIDRALVTSAFVLQPALLASVVQPGLDLPVVPAFLWTAVLLLRGRWVTAALLGVCLVFTKETGALLYAALVGSLVLWRPRVAIGARGARSAALLRVLALSLPGVVLGSYFLYRASTIGPAEPVVWNAGTNMIGQSLLRQLIVPRIDRHLATYLAILFVLSFAWVAAAGVGVGLVTVIARTAQRRGWARLRQDFTNAPIGYVAILSVTTIYALTRFATYANARYLLAPAPLILLLFLASLFATNLPNGRRRSLLGLLGVLLAVSAVRTIDPVSRLLFGTFPFGDRHLLRMTSISRECCAAGRDQLVYNLEFTTLAALTDDVLSTLRPGDSTVVVLPDSTLWHSLPLLDPISNRRTIDASRALRPPVVEADSAALFARARPAALYIALPNGPAERGLHQLSGAFEVGPEHRFERGPYWISAYRLTPRESAGRIP